MNNNAPDDAFVNTLALLLSFVFLAFLCFALGCGSLKVSGETKHKVEGEATIRLDVDMSICDSLPEADRAQCVATILDLLNKTKKEPEQ